MKNTRWFLTYGLLIAIALVGISYFFIDIPLVQWAHANDMRQYKWLHTAQQLPELFPYIAFIGLVILSLRSCWGKLTKIETAWLYSSISYIFANFLTKMLKMVFARTWPATWTNNNPSLLTDNVYGFFWFMDDKAYSSFPSGHTMAMFAVVVVLCYFYRQLKWIGGLACALVMAGLISNYYHFLSDIIAGAYLGAATGLVLLQHDNADKTS